MNKSAPDWAVKPVANLSEFEVLLGKERATAMQTKDFSTVDAIKTALIRAGVEVQMSKEGVKLTPNSDFDPAKLEGLR